MTPDGTVCDCTEDFRPQGEIPAPIPMWSRQNPLNLTFQYGVNEVTVERDLIGGVNLSRGNLT